AHVYLTYPFVLSWGLIEALAAECCVIASRTPPVEEVIDGRENGYLFDFFDREALVERLAGVLENQAATKERRRTARRVAVGRFDVKTVTLPAYLALIHRLSGQDPVPRVRPRPRRGGPVRPALAAVR